MTLLNPIKALRDISQDLSVRKPVPLALNGHVSPIDIQLAYYEAAVAFANEHGAVREEVQVLYEWGWVLSGLEVQGPLSMMDKIDWAAKLNLIEESGLSLEDPRAQLIDLQYHGVSRARSLYYKAQDQGDTERMVSDQDIEAAMSTAPATRARIRGDFIRRCRAHGADFSVSWNYLKLCGPPLLSIDAPKQEDSVTYVNDPFETENPGVNRVLEHMEGGEA